ncbi:hypothetical protein WISP_49355 [Willisornis vidua]|uniref:Uncharacterized protein n=1 Tax=Willisornis vidua TaxID=1566151 RepID=A0ABQ9DH40_9PASS|nr:hypothetical protein WISP_49355 [Willisornis vidua]
MVGISVTEEITEFQNGLAWKLVQGAGHIENEETSSNKLKAQCGVKKTRERQRNPITPERKEVPCPGSPVGIAGGSQALGLQKRTVDVEDLQTCYHAVKPQNRENKDPVDAKIQPFSSCDSLAVLIVM